MKNKIFLLPLMATFCLMAFSQFIITGKWIGHLVRPHTTDTATFVYDLKQTNDILTGNLVSPDGASVAIDSGKVVGNKFSFSITENDGLVKISGTCYTDSLGTDITLPNGRMLHMKMIRSK